MLQSIYSSLHIRFLLLQEFYLNAWQEWKKRQAEHKNHQSPDRWKRQQVQQEEEERFIAERKSGQRCAQNPNVYRRRALILPSVRCTKNQSKTNNDLVLARTLRWVHWSDLCESIPQQQHPIDLHPWCRKENNASQVHKRFFVFTPGHRMAVGWHREKIGGFYFIYIYIYFLAHFFLVRKFAGLDCSLGFRLVAPANRSYSVLYFSLKRQGFRSNLEREAWFDFHSSMSWWSSGQTSVALHLASVFIDENMWNPRPCLYRLLTM